MKRTLSTYPYREHGSNADDEVSASRQALPRLDSPPIAWKAIALPNECRRSFGCLHPDRRSLVVTTPAYPSESFTKQILIMKRTLSTYPYREHGSNADDEVSASRQALPRLDSPPIAWKAIALPNECRRSFGCLHPDRRSLVVTTPASSSEALAKEDF
jgi:hypothetical protein